MKQELDVDRLERTVREMESVAATVQMSSVTSNYLMELVEKLRVEKCLPIESIVIVTGTRTRVEEPVKKGMVSLGIDPNRLVIVNIREQCAWVHGDFESANLKAERMIRAGIFKSRMATPLVRQTIRRFNDVLVIGGGVAGIQASLDLSSQGYKVHLVERKPVIGGMMALLVKTFPEDDCTVCISGSRMDDIASDQNINLITYSEIDEVKRLPEGFRVKVIKKPRYVNLERCFACGRCTEHCPIEVPDEWNGYLGERKAIYLPFAQAIPRKYVIDAENCLYLKKGSCRICENVCSNQAIDFGQKPEIVELDVGAIIIAIGFENFDPAPYEKFNFQCENVITQFQLTRLLDGKGPTSGKLIRPSDGTKPKNIVMVQCVGSRDPETNIYCSRYCCTAAIKNAEIIKNNEENVDIKILYKDIRGGEKRFEELYNRVKEKLGVKFINGSFKRVVKLDNETFSVIYVNDKGVEEALTADLIVLSAGMVPSKGSGELAKKLGIDIDKNGFISEVDSKVASVITRSPGVYICGACGAPKDIPESIAQASAAAGMVTYYLRRDLGKDEKPISAPIVDEEACGRCGICVSVCPYSAIKMPSKGAVEINSELCQSCGLCISTCPARALDNSNYGFELLESQLSAILNDRRDSETIIIGLACNDCGYNLLDTIGVKRIKYSDSFIPVYVPCMSTVSLRHVFKALEMGADGVMLIGCVEDRCHYKKGVDHAERQLRLFEQLSKDFGRQLPVRVLKSCGTMLTQFLETLEGFVSELKEVKR